MNKQKMTTKELTTLAMLTAIAYALVCCVRIPIVLFLKYEPKDVVITIGGFLMGTMAGAIVGLAVGTACVVTTMLLWNYLITPLYMTGTSRSDIAGMLVPVFLPFNLLKAGLNSSFILLLYKPLVVSLRKAGLLPATGSGPKAAKTGVMLFAALLLISCVLYVLVLRGII